MSAACVHCELDNWDYDPRYTEGRCPICRTGPEGAPAAPRWLLVSRRLPWDLVFLVATFVVLLALAIWVMEATGLMPRPHVPGWHLPQPHVPLPGLTLLHLGRPS